MYNCYQATLSPVQKLREGLNSIDECNQHENHWTTMRSLTMHEVFVRKLADDQVLFVTAYHFQHFRKSFISHACFQTVVLEWDWGCPAAVC